MRFRLIVRWPSNYNLPTTYHFDSARAALEKHRILMKAGAYLVVILSVHSGETVRLAASQLAKTARLESQVVKVLSRRARGTMASMLLGLLASALPNGFGDFGVVSAHSA